ncbi:hypothetical protein BGZ68_010398 [Mortierella alpina]|nr:hypothetical protein BGZ68_010398 [Mortierella alpina]
MPFQHRYLGREQPPYSETAMPEYHLPSDRRNSQDMFISRSSPAALAEHQWRQEWYSWATVHAKTSLPMLQAERSTMSSSGARLLSPRKLSIVLVTFKVDSIALTFTDSVAISLCNVYFYHVKSDKHVVLLEGV